MQLYKQTGCHIFLVGYLEKTPEISMDQSGGLVATLTVLRKKSVECVSSSDSVLSYRVIVVGESALRIRQCAFPNLYIWVEGDFNSCQEKAHLSCEIIAERIGIIDFSEPAASNCLFSTETVQISRLDQFHQSIIENSSKFPVEAHVIH